ncbi:winged helix domain-containing protein, partial [Xanthomonas translucens]
APSSAELIGDYLDTLIDGADEALRYHDEDLQAAADPYEIDAAAMGRVVEALNALRMNDPDRLGAWFGRFITTYRAAGEILPPANPPAPQEVAAALQHGLVLQRHPWARPAWRRATRGATLFCSGLEFALPIKDARRLAAAEQLDGGDYAALSAAGRDTLLQLVEAGFYQPLDEPDRGDEDAHAQD